LIQVEERKEKIKIIVRVKIICSYLIDKNRTLGKIKNNFIQRPK